MDAAALSTTDLLARIADACHPRSDIDTDEYMALAMEISRRGGRAIIRQAVAWSTCADTALRFLGVDILAQLDRPDQAPFVADAVATLMALLGDANPEVISGALAALEHLEVGDIEAIRALAAHESAGVRASVAWYLGTRDEPLAHDTLAALSRDIDPEIRTAAIASLGDLTDIESDTIRQALVDRLADPASEVREEAMYGLALRGDPRANLPIEAALQAPEASEIVSMAALELEKRGNPVGAGAPPNGAGGPGRRGRPGGSSHDSGRFH